MVKDLVRDIHVRLSLIPYKTKLVEAESVGHSLGLSSDLDKARLALALLQSIRPTVSTRAEEDIEYFISSASQEPSWDVVES